MSSLRSNYAFCMDIMPLSNYNLQVTKLLTVLNITYGKNFNFENALFW